MATRDVTTPGAGDKLTHRRLAWVHQQRLLAWHWVAKRLRLPIAPTPSPDAKRELEHFLTRLVAILMLAFGVPLNLAINLYYYQEVFVLQHYPAPVYYVHTIGVTVITVIGTFLVWREHDRAAIMSIIVICTVIIYWQVYFLKDVNNFISLLLPLGMPAIVFSARKIMLIMVLLSISMIIFDTFVQLNGYIFGTIVSLLALEASFTTFGAGVRNVLYQTVADREAAAAATERTRIEARHAEEIGRERERDRLRRDLHDRLGNAFTSIGVQAEVAVRALPDNKFVNISEARVALLNIQQLADTGVDRLRRTIRNLRDEAVLQCSLPELVKREVEELHQTGIQGTLECPPSFPTLPPDVVGELLRVVQEALTNVQRHARATAVTVYLDHQEHESISLIVEDNGQGCDPSAVTTGFGLQGIQERVAALGGTFHPWTAPDQGFQVIVEVPLCV